MKKSLIMSTLALAYLASMGMESRKFYGKRPIASGREKPIALGRELTEQEKLKRHREYGADQTMHEYVINGVVIKATSKKVALKIYRRTYHENKIS